MEAAGRGEFGTACDARELVEWLRSDRRFDALRRDVLAELKRSRTGQPWLEYGPQQLSQLATGQKRVKELRGRVSRIARVLPEPLRPLIWTLPSVAGWPVHYRVADVRNDGRVALEPLSFRTPFQFVKETAI
jgi:hypothetical protein